MRRQFLQFLVRWGLNTAGLFIAALFVSGISYQNDWQALVIAGLVLSIVNALIKPFIIILSVPALLLTLGIFSIVINGFMVYLVDVLYRPFQVENFLSAILAGLVIGLVNYMLTRLFDAIMRED